MRSPPDGATRLTVPRAVSGSVGRAGRRGTRARRRISAAATREPRNSCALPTTTISAEAGADRVAWKATMSRSPQEILESATTIAVVGASRNPAKEAGSVPRIMQEHGFRVIPVNPYADELFGEHVYRSLGDIPEHVDIVDVFR